MGTDPDELRREQDEDDWEDHTRPTRLPLPPYGGLVGNRVTPPPPGERPGASEGVGPSERRKAIQAHLAAQEQLRREQLGQAGPGVEPGIERMAGALERTWMSGKAFKPAGAIDWVRFAEVVLEELSGRG